MTIKVRGIEFQDNLDNPMGLQFYNLSHRCGFQCPNWPYFQDVKIERIHYMAKSGVLSQRITTTMHSTTHIDAPAHVVQGTPFIDEVPLPHFFGSGIVVSMPKKKWESITADDLEKACGKAIRPHDVLIINTGWHKVYEDGDYFAYCPGFVPSAGRMDGRQAGQGRGPRHPGQRPSAGHRHRSAAQRSAAAASREGIPRMVRRRDWKDDFPEWEPVHQHPVQERHSRHRECRRRSRRRHRQALHLRLLPVELGPRRRLHHPPRRHHRSQAAVPHRGRARRSDAGQALRRCQALRGAEPSRRRRPAAAGLRAGRPDEPVGGLLAVPAGRRRGAGLARRSRRSMSCSRAR